MGKLVLITVLGAISMVGILNLSTNQNINFSLEKSVDYYAGTTARNIANSAISILTTKLSEDNTLRVESQASMDLFRGSASYTIRDVLFGSDSLVEISVTANYFDISKSVSTLCNVGGSELPPYLDYACLGEDEVRINGSFISIVDANDPNLNANVHSNGSIIINGSDINTEGFVTSTTAVNASGANITFTPNSNPDGLPTTSITSSITIPVTNVDDYIGQADETYFSDKTYTGNITLGTKSNPKTIYVQGKLFIDGIITGYGSFLVKDDIEVMGNLTINSPDPNEGNLFLMTNSKLIANHNTIEVYANIFAQSEININGNDIKLYGSLVSKFKIGLNNNYIKIYYKPISAELADDFFTVSSSSSRVSVLHWFE